MLSKNIEKLFRKLQSKKYRNEYSMFVAEGPKVVKELLEEGLEFAHLFSDSDYWVEKYEAIKVSSSDLKSVSRLETTNEVIGIFSKPSFEKSLSSNLVVVVDQLTDPGNLGTILRSCDWFGVGKLYCTTGTTDVFNSKCIQSTMGSIARVEVQYLENDDLLKHLEGHQLLVADMDGESVYQLQDISTPIALVMGSESHGPSQFWKEKAKPITIPKASNSKIESLNVSQATSIILSHLQKV